MRLVLAVVAILFSVARAQEPFSVSIELTNHHFNPTEIHVPAGQHIRLHLKNNDPVSEEFDSTALKVEKVFPANSEGDIRISPLPAGRYEFMGEYHPETAKGVVIAE